jgi:hypothetical protein
MSPSVSSAPSAPPKGPTAEPKASSPPRGETASFAATLSPPVVPTPPQTEPPEAPPLPDVAPLTDEPAQEDLALPEDAPPPPPEETPLATPQGDTPRRPSRPDPLDPSARHAAQMAPPMLSMSAVDSTTSAGGAAAPPPDVMANVALETLLPELVRKVAWSGDGKRGSMRLELGKGALAGGVVTVHADEGRVRVVVDAPVGTDTAAWKQKLESRLAARGVDVEDLEVK